jgi:DNA-binding PadR family transcriptional regulator
MSATRLLILGAVRIFQPIHGYDLRRELMTWHADQWANISFGSIYFALKKMAEDRLLEEVETDRAGGRPARTLYRLTSDGESEFQMLLREFWWERKPVVDPFFVALSQGPALSRTELAAALRHRADDARGGAERLRFEATARLSVDLTGQEKVAIALVAEMMGLMARHQVAEAEWADDLAGRIESGAFTFPEKPREPGHGHRRLPGVEPTD